MYIAQKSANSSRVVNGIEIRLIKEIENLDAQPDFSPFANARHNFFNIYCAESFFSILIDKPKALAQPKINADLICVELIFKKGSKAENADLYCVRFVLTKGQIETQNERKK